MAMPSIALTWSTVTSVDSPLAKLGIPWPDKVAFGIVFLPILSVAKR